MAFASGLIYLPFLLLFGAFVFGSVLARRGEKSWRTLMMLIGSIAQAAGILFYIVTMILMFSNLSSGSGSSGLMTLGVVMATAGVLFLGGVLCFTIAFVAYCARAGAAGKRAEELEEMLIHLQQRVAEQDRI